MTGSIVQKVLDVAATKFGKGILTAGVVPILGRHQLAPVILYPQFFKLAGKFVPYIAHHVQEVRLIVSSFYGVISYDHIGADLITLASMLRIPVYMHNVPAERIFRPIG